MSGDMPRDMWRTLPGHHPKKPVFSSPEEPESTTPLSSPQNPETISRRPSMSTQAPARRPTSSRRPPGPALQRGEMTGRLASYTYDRTKSILDLQGTGNGDLAPYNRAHAKLVNDMTRCLAEIELRLGLRTVPVAQATVRLEKLRQDLADNQFESEAHLAMALAEEYHSVVNRLETLCQNFENCGNRSACCSCQFPPLTHDDPTFSVADHCTGREIQSYVQMHAAQHTTESGTVRAIYDGLGEFFVSILGAFDPSKERCQSRAGFLRAWRSMTQRPEYFNKLDAELGKVQAQALARRARGEHVKKSRISLSGLFGGRKNLGDDRPGSSGSWQTF